MKKVKLWRKLTKHDKSPICEETFKIWRQSEKSKIFEETENVRKINFWGKQKNKQKKSQTLEKKLSKLEKKSNIRGNSQNVETVKIWEK